LTIDQVARSIGCIPLPGFIQVLGRMKNTRARQATEVDLTLGGRFAAAFGSLIFSVPLMGLFWLLFSSRIFLDSAIPLSYFGAAVAAFSAFSFFFPRLAPELFGWLCDRFIGIAKWW
jgi:hypothetical protein